MGRSVAGLSVAAVSVLGGCSSPEAQAPGVIGDTGSITVVVTASDSVASDPTAQERPTARPFPTGLTRSGETDRSDPEQVAAAFVERFASRRATDSLADNFALRAAPFATPALVESMMTQASSGLSGPPAELYARVTAARRLPNLTGPGRAGYRVEFTVTRDPYEIGESTLREAALNCSLVLGADGTWLVSAVDYGAN